MNPNTDQLLRELSQKLGISIQFILDAYVKQAYVYGWTAIGSYIFSIAVILSFFAFTRFKQKEFEERGKNFDKENYLFPSFLAGIFIIAFLCSVGSVISAFANPQYWALKELLSNF